MLALTLPALIISGCGASTLVPSTPTRVQLAPTYVGLPTRAPLQTATPTQKPTSTPAPLTQSTPPAWVTKFSEPILEAAADQYASFQDDFTAQLNRGWFYFISNDRRRPIYAHLEEGALILRIPDGREHRDAMVYSPQLAVKNLVLSLDFKFEKTQPDDIFRLQFEQTQNERVTIDLSKNETSALEWNFYNHWQSVTGVYDHFGPALVNIVFIMRDQECALYINHDPFAYLPECRANPILLPTHESVSLHLLSTTGNPARVDVDNVKVWDLDEINFSSP